MAPRLPLTRIGPVLVKKDDLETLRVLADQTDSSVNREIRRAIRFYIEMNQRRGLLPTPPATPPEQPAAA